jgi:hypothetical protein
VRLLMGGAQKLETVPVAAQTSKGRIVIHGIAVAADFLAQYPGPGMEDWYRRYKRGAL